MRISTRTGWVATAYLLLGVVNGQDGSLENGRSPNSKIGSRGGNTQAVEVVTFNPMQFNGNHDPTRAIFVLRDDLWMTVNWTTQDWVTVDTIDLWQKSSDENEEKLITSETVDKLDGQQIDQAAAPTQTELGKVLQGKPAEGMAIPGQMVKRQSTPGTGSVCRQLLRSARQYGGGGLVSLYLDENANCAIKTGETSSFKHGDPLFFKAHFKSNTATGFAYSRAFTIVTNDAQMIEYAMGQDIYGDSSPFKNITSVPTTQDSALPTGAAPTSEGNETSLSQPAPTRSGLELGAIIGIAVGCGLFGLLAVLGIIWFVVRRRQEKQNLRPIGSFNSDHRGDDLMAEKERNTAGDPDASPNSPYSDDGRAVTITAAAATTAATAAAPHPQDQARSYTPYSDLPGAGAGAGNGDGAPPSVRTASIAQNDEGARANIPSPIPGRATPRGLTTPYAHLVEEGMTEEEIRRLEEEERQLDAAIEQAGRR